jgi:hypothetical protein
MCLTGQHIAGIQFGGPEREVLVHRERAVDELGPARAAGADHAGMGGVTTALQGALHNGVARCERNVSCCPDSVKGTVAEAESLLVVRSRG